MWAPPKQIRAASTICMQCNLLVCSTHSVVVTTCGTMRAIMIGLVLVVQCNILRNRLKHLLSSTASPGGHPQSLFLKHSFTFLFSSVRSSYSHPDLLVIHHHHHPLFQITPVLDNNIGLSLSEPPQLYKGYNAILRQSLDWMCWLHGCLMGSTGHH